MTRLTKNEILHVAKLSNLNLSNDEIEKFTPQLSKIVGFISELSEVDTKNVEPTVQTTGLTNIFRKDRIKKEAMLTQEEALSGAKNKHSGHFKVPVILDERTLK